MTEDTPPISPLAARMLASARARGLHDYLLERPLVVGVSGGADSLSLLYLLYELRAPAARQSLHVAHLNHGFRGDEALEDARFVAQAAERLGLACTVAHADVPAFAKHHHLSDEDAARRVRYAFLARVASDHSAAVAVAHTADDQAETVLMHLLRGSGIGGLAGMKTLSTARVDQDADLLFDGDAQVSPGTIEIFRPLLEVRRSEIEAYCAEWGLAPRHDATNSDTRLRRNEVRHSLLPELERLSPGVGQQLVRLADIARADDAALEAVASVERERVAHYDKEARSVSFDAAGLRSLPEGVQRRIIRQAVELLAGRLEDIEFSHVLAALEVILGASNVPAADLPHDLRVERAGMNAAIFTRSGSFERTSHNLITTSRWPMLAPGYMRSVEPGGPYALEASWTLLCDREGPGRDPDCPGLLCALFDQESLPSSVLYLRTRQLGDYIRPMGMSGRKSLQDLFVDAKIPWVLRERVAVIALSQKGGEVLWVPGPGGRRSGIAPLNADTRQTLRLQFSLRENT